jgi:cell division protein FtsN
MRQSSTSPSPARDYSGLFLGAILLGIIAMVLGLTMAAAHSAPVRSIEQQSSAR